MGKRIFVQNADFLTEEKFLTHSETVDAASPALTYTGIPLDYLGENRYAGTKREQHTIIVGDTGCGKTRRVIIPTIKLLGKTGESMVISDPKGELYQKTSRALKERGYEIRVLNMREPRRGDRWNPLEMVETLYKSKDENMQDKGLIMLDEIIDQMGACVQSDRDKFWEQVSKQFIKAVALTILEYAAPKTLNFRNIALACNDILGVLNKKVTHGSSIFDDDEDWEDSDFMKFYDELPDDSIIKQNFASTACVSADNTFTSIATLVFTMVNLYTRQESIKFLFSKTDFDIYALGKRSMALFIILPDELLTLYPLATLFVSQIYSTLIDLAFNNGGMLPNKVNFILDEFANFTKMPNISSMLTASRSRGIRFCLVVQDIDQLKYQYGEAASAIIYSNCQNLIFMGCRNAAFLKALVELSGMYTEAYTGITRPLISITDFQSLEVGEAFIFIRSCSPKHSYFPDYTEVDFGEGVEGSNAKGFAEDFSQLKTNSAKMPEPLYILQVFSDWRKQQYEDEMKTFEDSKDSDSDDGYPEFPF